MLDPGHIKISKTLILGSYKLGGRQMIKIQGIALCYKKGSNKILGLG